VDILNMKASFLFAAVALAGSALAINAQINPIVARNIDPQTMDPTRLSVLKVLKTAMPTDPNVPMPTGDNNPEWYEQLPEDVKDLLPALYGMKAVIAAASSAADAAMSSATALTSSVAIESSSSGTVDTVSASSPTPSVSASTSTSSNSSTSLLSPGTSQTTVTKTLQHASTGIAVPTNGSANGTLGTPTASLSPTASNLLSTGVNTATAIRIENLAAAVWLALGTGFFLFA
jgi:hypothetical protein